MSTINYRSDIDGLRAIAVISVIAYHFSESYLSGGFLGVDIFFVLSGFLITKIIWTEIEDNRFTIGRFYERRIRRIMPALLFVLIATTVAAIAVLLPADLVGYGKSLIATLTFVANIYFWRDTNYFSRVADEKPLLHIWSLGVEEQFYVLFPVILIFAARYWRRGALSIIILLTMASLGADIFLRSIGGSNPAFYLLPTRAWELGVGAIVALLPSKLVPQNSLATLAAGLGAILIAYALIFAKAWLLFLPIAFPVVLGTGLIIWSGVSSQQFAGRLLSFSPLVMVGKISYSLYLWHWPVIVYANYYLVRQMKMWEILAAIMFMCTCAVFSYYFVERPFQKRRMPFSHVAKYGLTSAVVLFGLAALLLATDGLPSRLSTEAASINRAVGTNYRCPVTNYISFGSSRACTLNLANRNPYTAQVVLFGNSHAQMYAPLVKDILESKSIKGLLVPMNGCLPTISVNISKYCAQVASNNLQEILKIKTAQTVLVGLTWEHEHLVDENGQTIDRQSVLIALINALDDLINRIERTGRQIILIGPIPYPGWDVASIVSRERAFGRKSKRKHVVPASKFIDQFSTTLVHFSKRLGHRFIRADKALCDATNCYFILDKRSVFADSNHIASAELQRFRPVFWSGLANLQSSPPQ